MTIKSIEKIQWYDAKKLEISGKGWKETKNCYDRLPAKAEGVVRDAVWDLSRSATGVTVHFTTDAPLIKAKWILESQQLSTSHMCTMARSGLDLYARDGENRWRWVNAPKAINSQTPEVELVSGIEPVIHDFMLYLPLFNPISNLEIGVPENYKLTATHQSPGKSIVYYGTSIVHGVAASRPGMTHSAILGRRLDCQIINLGFDGNAKMEPEIADLLIELDPEVYVLDALPNMPANLVEERAEIFIRKISQAHPETPIVLIEDRTYTNSWILPELRMANDSRRKAFHKVYKALKSDGICGLHYIKGEHLLGSDDDASVDGSHPSDLGFSRMADTLEPILKRILKK